MIDIINIDNIKEWAIYQHDVVCNQKYNKIHPYSFHLEMVHTNVIRFKHLLETGTPKTISLPKIILARAGAYCHDLIEDARITYNDIISETQCRELAEIVFACTELRGRNREERHGSEYYALLKTNEIAIYVKLCDIIANVLYGLMSNSSMFSKYKKEHEHMKSEIYRPEFDEMFVFLENIYKIPL